MAKVTVGSSWPGAPEAGCTEASPPPDRGQLRREGAGLLVSGEQGDGAQVAGAASAAVDAGTENRESTSSFQTGVSGSNPGVSQQSLSDWCRASALRRRQAAVLEPGSARLLSVVATHVSPRAEVSLGLGSCRPQGGRPRWQLPPFPPASEPAGAYPRARAPRRVPHGGYPKARTPRHVPQGAFPTAPTFWSSPA